MLKNNCRKIKLDATWDKRSNSIELDVAWNLITRLDPEATVLVDELYDLYYVYFPNAQYRSIRNRKYQPLVTPFGISPEQAIRFAYSIITQSRYMFIRTHLDQHPPCQYRWHARKKTFVIDRLFSKI